MRANAVVGSTIYLAKQVERARVHKFASFRQSMTRSLAALGPSLRHRQKRVLALRFKTRATVAASLEP